MKLDWERQKWWLCERETLKLWILKWIMAQLHDMCSDAYKGCAQLEGTLKFNQQLLGLHKHLKVGFLALIFSII